MIERKSGNLSSPLAAALNRLGMLFFGGFCFAEIREVSTIGESMKDKRLPTTIAIGFFIIWFAILLAGADFPPPIGSLWMVFLDIVAAFVIYFRVPTYVLWVGQRKRGRLARTLLDGLTIGLVFALAIILVPGGGEPSFPPLGWVDYLIWSVIVGSVGAVNAVVVYCIVFFIKKRRSG